jgi:hypothetical protein
MKNWITAVCMLILLACAAPVSNINNPSGVWDLGNANMNYVHKFSWGENPINSGAYIIDLGDPKPYLTTGADHLFVTSTKQSGNRLVFFGDWGPPEGKGSLTAVFGADWNTMYFENTDPVGRANIGPEYMLKRVPMNARVIPIDPVKGP